jgi:hypothetical protein
LAALQPKMGLTLFNSVSSLAINFCLSSRLKKKSDQSGGLFAGFRFFLFARLNNQKQFLTRVGIGKCLSLNSKFLDLLSDCSSW